MNFCNFETREPDAGCWRRRRAPARQRAIRKLMVTACHGHMSTEDSPYVAGLLRGNSTYNGVFSMMEEERV
ncbi:hypothetical protein EVAR_33827_1 [Eumeta japonica]|uniref:Uncharacterized protein n=1 Tax=Eumeta variegata TaxID=151549 RepID=A0A4C1VCF2_EUMVA|nr:hypothetical protein EVAR_33827_1 [Eumeta japonica]